MWKMLNSFNQVKVVLMLTAKTLWNTVVILAILFFLHWKRLHF